MSIALTHSRSKASAARRTESRTFAHHYGSIVRSASPDRLLRVYPPLGWGTHHTMPHVRRAERVVAERLDEQHITRPPLKL